MLDRERMEAIERRCRQAPCIAALGFELLEAEPGFCRLAARHDPRFDGLMPGFHGGMLANVADCVAWYALVTQVDPDEPLVTTDLTIHYLNPCLTDVVSTGRVVKLGRTLCTVSVDLFDLEGKLVATAHVTYIRQRNLKSSS